METAKAHRKVESKEMSVTEMELKRLLLGKKKTGRYLERSELALSRNLAKEKSIGTREALGQDQGECRNGESFQENAEQAFQLEINCKGRKSRICSHKILPRPILTLRRTGGVNPIRETALGGAVEKHENRLCWWNVDLAIEIGTCLEDGKVAVVDELEHGFSGRLAVFVDDDGSESEERVDGLTPNICDERADGMTHKIDGERVERLTRIIHDERADGLCQIQIDGERVERLTCKIREERVDGLPFKIDAERADGWSTITGEERADGWTYQKSG